MKIGRFLILLAIVIVVLLLHVDVSMAQPPGGGPGGGADPHQQIPISQFAILLILIAKGLGIYKFIKDKKSPNK